MIRKVEIKEFEKIYRELIVVDFPKNERRPLLMIKDLFRKGLYFCWVLCDNEEVSAYACFMQNHDKKSMLLDYFAVAANKRGSGIGSTFLELLREQLSGGGVIIECEMPEKASGEKEAEIRKRRIEFYRRNGAVLSDFGWSAFGVDYKLLWLPLEDQLSEVKLEEEIKNIYSKAMPSFLAKKLTS